MSRKVLSGIVVSIFLAPFVALTFAQQRMESVQVGVIPVQAFAPFYAAMEKAYFEEQGIKVEAVPTRGGAESLPAVAGGSLQIAYVSYELVFMAQEQGFDFIIIAANTRERVKANPQAPSGYEGQAAIIALEESGIKTVRDLKGRSLAVNGLKNINWLEAVELLSRNGVDRDQVQWVELPFPQMGAALRAKKVDAAYAVEPTIAVEKDRGGLRIIDWPRAAVLPDPPADIAGLVASKAWVDKNPALVERFVAAFYKATDWLNKNPGELVPLVARYTRLKPEVVQKMERQDMHHPLSIKSLQMQADLALKWGLIKKALDVRRIVHPTALK